MDESVFENFGIEIFKRDDLLFVRYDAGHITSSIREDRISEAEAQQAIQSEGQAYQMLLALQNRLTDAGIDAYKSNVASS
jgi:hypothetical protein